MSNQGTREKEPNEKQRSSRIIKSGEAAGVRLAFPTAEAVATGGQPPSRLFPEAAPAPVSSAPDLMAAKAKAEAMERRAAALLQEAEQTAQERLAEAAKAVETMLNQAAEAATALQQRAQELARAEGYEVGYAQGKAAALQEADQVRAAGAAEAEQLVMNAQAQAEMLLGEANAQAEALLAEADRERQALLEGARDNVLALAFAVARQVLKAELTLQPAAVLPMVEAALSKLKGDSHIRVRVSPEMVMLLESQRGRLLAAVPGLRELSIDPDPSMAPGDWIAQGTQGYVDGRLERQVQVIAQEVAPSEAD